MNLGLAWWAFFPLRLKLQKEKPKANLKDR